MLVIICVIGLGVGWLVNAFSTIAPRFAAEPQPTSFNGGFASVSTIWWFIRSRVQRPQWLWLHLAVEVFCVVSAAVIWAQWGSTLNTVGALVLLVFLLLIAVTDVKHRLVLNVLVYPACVLALVYNVILLQYSLRLILLGGGLSFGIFFLASMLRPGDIGGGDVKLATLIGLIFGFPRMLWALLVGGSAGALVALYLLKKRSGITAMPYAPFLCLGALIALLYNPVLILR